MTAGLRSVRKIRSSFAKLPRWRFPNPLNVWRVGHSIEDRLNRKASKKGRLLPTSRPSSRLWKSALIGFPMDSFDDPFGVHDGRIIKNRYKGDFS